MSTIVHQYRFFCLEENKNILQWGTTPPTICPNDHTNKTIDTNSITIVKTINEKQIKAIDSSEGFYCVEQYNHNISSGSVGNITEINKIWDSNILLWKTIFTPTSELLGDEINVVFGPETLVGTSNAITNVNDVNISVSETVINNIMRGFELVLDDGVNKHKSIIINIDSNTGIVTIKEASPYTFGSNTPVYLNIYALKFIVSDINPIIMGDKGLQGKVVPQGTTMRIYHTNNDGLEKKLIWRAEFYNQG